MEGRLDNDDGNWYCHGATIGCSLITAPNIEVPTVGLPGWYSDGTEVRRPVVGVVVRLRVEVGGEGGARYAGYARNARVPRPGLLMTLRDRAVLGALKQFL